MFAERLGLDPAAFLDVARGSASYSQVMETKGPKMVRGDFSPEGRVKQTLKDVRLMLDQAASAGRKVSMLGVHADVLEALRARRRKPISTTVPSSRKFAVVGRKHRSA